MAGPMAQTQFFQFPYEQVLATNLRLEKARSEAMASNLQFNQELDAVSTIPGTEDIEQTLTAPYRQQMSDVVDKYGGDMGKAQSELQNVYYDYYMNMNNGIKQLKNADAQYQATKKRIQDGIDKGTFDPQTGMLKLQQQTQKYNEQLAAWNAGEGPLPTGNVFGAVPFKRPDIHADMMQIIDKIKPEQIAEIGLEYDPSTGGYTDATRTIKYSSAEARQLAAVNYLQSSDDYRNYAREQAQLGLGPEGAYNPNVHGSIYDMGSRLDPLIIPLSKDENEAKQQMAFAGVSTPEQYEEIRKYHSDTYNNSVYQDVTALMNQGMSKEDAENLLAQNKHTEIQAGNILANIASGASLGAYSQESLTNVGGGSGSGNGSGSGFTGSGIPFTGEARAIDLKVVDKDNQYRVADSFANLEATKDNMDYGKYTLNKNILNQAAKNVGLSQEDMEEIAGADYSMPPGVVGVGGAAMAANDPATKEFEEKKAKQNALYAEVEKLQNQVIFPQFTTIDADGAAANELNKNLLQTGTNIDTQLDLISLAGEAPSKGDKKDFKDKQNITVRSISKRPFVDENGNIKYLVKGTYGKSDEKKEFEAYLNDPVATQNILQEFGQPSASIFDKDLAYLSHSGTVVQPREWGNDDRFRNVAVQFDQATNEQGQPVGAPVYSFVEYDPQTGLAVEDENGNSKVVTDTNGNPYQYNNYRAMTTAIERTMNQLTYSPPANSQQVQAQASAQANAANNALLNIATGNVSGSDMMRLRYLLNDYPAIAGGNFIPSKAPNKGVKNPFDAAFTDIPGAVQDLQPGAASPENVTYSKTPFEFAQAWLGYSEENQRHNRVLSAAMKEYAGININPAQTPWCSAFANTVLNAFGYEGTGKLNARSWLNWGQEVSELGDAQEGDLVVFKRGNNPNQGHVGFYAGLNQNGNPLVLGGNQGATGDVSIIGYNKNDLLGIRRAQ